MDTTTLLPLARFRAGCYQDVLGLRRDALFELLDAVLTDAGPTGWVRPPAARPPWRSSNCSAR
jgi:hypothetical protein